MWGRNRGWTRRVSLGCIWFGSTPWRRSRHWRSGKGEGVIREKQARWKVGGDEVSLVPCSGGGDRDGGGDGGLWGRWRWVVWPSLSDFDFKHCVEWPSLYIYRRVSLGPVHQPASIYPNQMHPYMLHIFPFSFFSTIIKKIYLKINTKPIW